MTSPAAKKTAYYGFTGLIEPSSVTRIASAFNLAVNNGYDQIYLCISSHGGLISDGVYLYNHIRGLPVHVIAHNTGTVASIAAAIFVGADERYCSAHGMFMIHPTSMQNQEMMSAERLQASLDAALADDNRTENILRERTTIPDDLLAARLSKECYITPEEAVKFGLANSVCDFALPSGHEIIQI